MPDKKAPEFPELMRPPIVEVVCGIVFEQVPDLDALMFGVYWDERKKDFPKRQLHPALSDELGFAVGVMPMRAFLMSEDDQFIIQLQHDRFFMNWRATGQGYPRFSERHGPRGLLVRMQEEWAKFGEFVKRRCGRDLSPRRIELNKIDVLEKDQHWKSIEDLSRLLPVTDVFQDVQRAETRDVNLRFVEKAGDGVAIIHVATLSDGETPRAIRIDARFVTDPVPSLAEAFKRGDEVLNEAFFKLIPLPAARGVGWATSDASTCCRAAIEATPRVAELNLAVAEVQTARSILAARELRAEAAFESYLRSIEVALDSYDSDRQSGVPGHELRLATALAVARTSLHDVVSRLPSWLAITRATGRSERFTSVPRRFRAIGSTTLHHDEGLDSANLVGWSDLDSGA